MLYVIGVGDGRHCVGDHNGVRLTWAYWIIHGPPFSLFQCLCLATAITAISVTSVYALPEIAIACFVPCHWHSLASKYTTVSYVQWLLLRYLVIRNGLTPRPSTACIHWKTMLMSCCLPTLHFLSLWYWSMVWYFWHSGPKQCHWFPHTDVLASHT